MNQQLLEILACPLCKGNLLYDASKAELICRFDKLAYPIKNAIPILLADEARRLETEEV